ncbi:MAG: prepilin-type N-terminal cleavage/methylation domain-containing protein [Candidatus Omnitrophica bacterium]|nr:prepilin-type N-terminal cleavage/methylation domain-containing protein [Candidatus Omnitrophota bacterium]
MNRNGFSIAEVLVSIAIFSIVSLAVFTTFQVGTNSWDVISTQSYLAGEARNAVEKMSKELRKSKLSNIDTSQAGQISFKLPTVNASTGTISSWSNWIRYSRGGVGGNQLLRTDTSTGIATVLANDVTGLQFVANSNPSTVTATLTAQDVTPKGTTVPVNLTSTVELRN